MRKRNKRCSVKDDRHLGLESLEARQMLTIMAPWYPGTATLPQDSPGTELLSWLELEAEEFTQPSHGTLNYDSEAGRLTYIPDAGYVGADSFTYSTPFASDVSFQLTVTETVYAVPDWMRVNPGSDSQSIDLLGNDYFVRGQLARWGPSDPEYLSLSDVAYRTIGPYWMPEQGELTIVGVTGGDHGTVSTGDDGRSLSYQPNAGFTGTDIVEYTVEDVLGHRSTAQLTVEVSNTPIRDDAYTSEAEFVHDRIDAWMEAYARHLDSTPYLSYRVSLGGDVMVFNESQLEVSGTSPSQLPEVTEGDIVKRGGDYLFIASKTHSQLSIVDMSDPTEPQLVSSVGLEQPIIEMYVDQDRLTLITADPHDGLRFAGDGPSVDQATVHLIDVSAPENPMRLFSAEIEGKYQDSRVIGQSLHLVASLPSSAQLPVPGSLNPDNLPITSPSIFVDQLLAEGASAFLPDIQVRDSQGEHALDLIDWSEIQRLGTEPPDIIVATFDLSGESGLPTDVEATELGLRDYEAPTVHFSSEAAYLLGNGEIVKFDLEADGSGVEFAAEGKFHGRILDQFSVDEHEGRLRIATTEEGGSGQVNVHVLEQVGTSVEVVSSLIDIAPGERIYSTRFDGDRAFVVTFRTVDPLFVIDLSDPTSPTIAGELKVPGFSNYLHVINEDYVIGVGRNADPDSGLFEELQVSLFNVSDPTNPVLVDRYAFEGGRDTWSVLVEGPRQLGDHQAFHYVEEEAILALPFHTGSPPFPPDTDGIPQEQSAVRFFQIDVTGGIEAIGDVEFESRALRSLQLGEYMVSMSDSELKVTDLTDPAQLHAAIDLISDTPVGIDDVAMARSYEASADLDGDGINSPLDALMIIHQFNRTGAGRMDDILSRLEQHDAEAMQKYDVDRDGVFNAIDALRVVNAMNARPAIGSPMSFSMDSVEEGSPESASSFEQYVDALFAEVA